MLNKLFSILDNTISIITQSFQLATYILVSTASAVFLFEHQATLAYIIKTLIGG